MRNFTSMLNGGQMNPFRFENTMCQIRHNYDHWTRQATNTPIPQYLSAELTFRLSLATTKATMAQTLILLIVPASDQPPSNRRVMYRSSTYNPRHLSRTDLTGRLWLIFEMSPETPRDAETTYSCGTGPGSLQTHAVMRQQK